MKPITILRTERLVLRPWRDSDLVPFAVFNADPKVMEFYEHPLSQRESDALVEKFQHEYAERGYGFWAVEAPGIADFIGYVGLNYWNLEMPFAPCIDIGWRLGSPYWGNGYALEGAKAALSYGFETLGFLEIFAMATVGNSRSRRLMERLGMHLTENFEHPKLPKGHPLSWRVLYCLSSSEYSRKSQKLLP